MIEGAGLSNRTLGTRGSRLLRMAGESDDVWTYVSLTLSEPGWPGTARAEWVAATARAEKFRTRDLLAAMDRLGREGWELVTFAPAWGDRSASFYFKTRSTPHS